MKSIFKKFYIIALSAALLVNATACGKQTALSQPAPSSQSASLAGETTNHIYTQSIQNLEANAQASFDMFQSPLSFIVLYIFFVHVIGLQSEKAQSPPQRDLPSPTENPVHQLLQTALL